MTGRTTAKQTYLQVLKKAREKSLDDALVYKASYKVRSDKT